MAICGVIAEYNPMHNGHAYLIRKLRDGGADSVAVVMSGDFVQRGEAAVFSKWTRTKAALRCGADLVVELPLPWAVAGAERFALGGVSLLTELGVEKIGFGSECGCVRLLEEAEKALLSPELHTAMQCELKKGLTFAAARQKAVGRLFGDRTAELLREPNNILGIEYIKAIRKLNSGLIPCTVKRERKNEAGFTAEEPDCCISSARIRAWIRAGEDCSGWIPPAARSVFGEEIRCGGAPADLSYLERGILAKLRTMTKNELALLPDISEGLENRIYAAARKAVSLTELYSLIKTKRYPMARIKRIILSAVLGLDSTFCPEVPPYLRILGIGSGGIQILQKVKQNKHLPILTRYSDAQTLEAKAKKIFELENRSADLFALCTPNAGPCGSDSNTGVICLNRSNI